MLTKQKNKKKINRIIIALYNSFLVNDKSLRKKI